MMDKHAELATIMIVLGATALGLLGLASIDDSGAINVTILLNDSNFSAYINGSFSDRIPNNTDAILRTINNSGGVKFEFGRFLWNPQGDDWDFVAGGDTSLTIDDTDNRIMLNTSYLNRVMVTNDGLVGVNISNPLALLHVQGDAVIKANRRLTKSSALFDSSQGSLFSTYYSNVMPTNGVATVANYMYYNDSTDFTNDGDIEVLRVYGLRTGQMSNDADMALNGLHVIINDTQLGGSQESGKEMNGLIVDVVDRGGENGDSNRELQGIDVNVRGTSNGSSRLTGLDVFVTGGDTNYAALFSGGNVGIVEDTPVSTLDVTGTIRVTTGTMSCSVGTYNGSLCVGNNLEVDQNTWLEQLFVFQNASIGRLNVTKDLVSGNVTARGEMNSSRGYAGQLYCYLDQITGGTTYTTAFDFGSSVVTQTRSELMNTNNSKCSPQEDGVYEVLSQGNVQSTVGQTYTGAVIVDTSNKHSQSYAIYNATVATNPYTIHWIGQINKGQNVTIRFDANHATTGIALQSGSTFSIKRVS